MAAAQLTVTDSEANGRPVLDVSCVSSEPNNDKSTANNVMRFIAKHWDKLVFAAALDGAPASVAAAPAAANAQDANLVVPQGLKLFAPGGGLVDTEKKQ